MGFSKRRAHVPVCGSTLKVKECGCAGARGCVCGHVRNCIYTLPEAGRVEAGPLWSGSVDKGNENKCLAPTYPFIG